MLLQYLLVQSYKKAVKQLYMQFYLGFQKLYRNIAVNFLPRVDLDIQTI